MRIEFIGAARQVTGSKTLITTNLGKKILIDCGMYQGKGMETDSLNRNIGVNPEDIDHIILSHAHIDHSGLIPYFYKLGFRGSVICTNATRNLCSIMLPDSGFIQEFDMKWFNKKRAKQNLPKLDPIYTVADAEKSIELFIGVEYNRRFYIDKNINVKFTHVGHMLGSGVINLEIEENGEKRKIAYTGDIGRKINKILQPPMPFPQCEYLITESTYGDRLHEPSKMANDRLLAIIKDTCIRRRGKLIIPSFAIGRTQQIVFMLNVFFNDGLLPNINVYVDSPLAVNATEIFRMHKAGLGEAVQQEMRDEHDSDPFGFNKLHYIKKVEESKALNDKNEPCIIISSSGMAEAGRVKHHISNNIQNSRNTILIVGYCSPTSLGARLQRKGIKDISIFGQNHKVLAKIEKIEAFSGHADYEEMISFISCQDKMAVKNIFLVHGEYDVQKAYREHLFEAGFGNVEIPKSGMVVDI